MPELHPTFIEQDGAPLFVVLPYVEFAALKKAATENGDEIWDTLFADPRSVPLLDKLYADGKVAGPPKDMAYGFRARAASKCSGRLR